MKGDMIPKRDHSMGMVTAVNDALMPNNALRLLLNCYTDEAYGNQYGNIMSRYGYGQIGSATYAKPILGMGNWIDAVSDTSYLVRMVNDNSNTNAHTEYYDSVNGWTEIGNPDPTEFTQGKKTRFTTFLNLLFAVNGSDPARVWDGNPNNPWSTTNTNIVGAPAGSLIVNFQDRLHIAGLASEPSGIYSSSIVGGDPFTISWDTTDEANILPVNPDDNDRITALANNGGVMGIWKRSRMYTWNGSATQSDELIQVGTPSQECVVTIDGISYFFGIKGKTVSVYQFKGEPPLDVGKPIKQFFDAIDPTMYDKTNPRICAWQDDDAVCWFVGDVTVDGREYVNAYYRLCISKGTWSIGTLNDAITCAAPWYDGTANQVVLGTSLGKTHQWATGYSDDGAAIEVIARGPRDDMGFRLIEKTINAVNVLGEATQNISFQTRIDRFSNFDDWGSLDVPDKNFTELEIIGQEIEVQFAGMLKTERMQLAGYELVDWYMDPPTP